MCAHQRLRGLHGLQGVGIGTVKSNGGGGGGLGGSSKEGFEHEEGVGKGGARVGDWCEQQLGLFFLKWQLG